jgi:hypothetical protein
MEMLAAAYFGITATAPDSRGFFHSACSKIQT